MLLGYLCSRTIGAANIGGFFEFRVEVYTGVLFGSKWGSGKEHATSTVFGFGGRVLEGAYS